MSVITWDTAKTKPRKDDPQGFVKVYVSEAIGAKKLRIHLSVVGPHRKPHEPHQHDGEEIFFILEGEGKVIVGNKEYKVGPMTAVFIPPNVFHGIENTGDKPLKYLVIIAK